MSNQQKNTCPSQGGIITGNLGTRFPRNLKVSHEILIVNPAHLSRKCDTPKRQPKIHKKTILCHKKNHSYDRKFISFHRKFISCHRKFISCHRKFISCHGRFISCDRTFISCHKKFISCHRNKKRTPRVTGHFSFKKE